MKVEYRTGVAFVKVFTVYVLTEHRTIPVKVLVRSLILLLYPENSEMWPGDVILTFQ